MRMPRLFVTLILILLTLTAAVPAAYAAADSSGTDYWVTFMQNIPPDGHLYLSISAVTATSGTVTNASLGINIPFVVTPGTPTVVEVPFTAQLDQNDTIENKGVHVTSLAPVVVYGMNSRTFTADGYLALPTDAIGTDYIIMSWGSGIGAGTELAIVGTQNNTHVTLRLVTAAGSHAAGPPFDIVLNQGQTFFLNQQDDHDLTGSTIVSDKAISVFGGHACGLVPNGLTDFCDHMEEQMFPTTAWGTSFLTVPTATRSAGDVFRVVASQDGTSVSVNGAVAVPNLDAGHIYETVLTAPAFITTTKPAAMAQYPKGLKGDNNIVSDPFEMLILPSSRFLSSYILSTPGRDFQVNFLNVVAPTTAVGSVRLDGGIVAPGSFTPIGASGYSSAQLSIAPGGHSVTASMPVGVSVYGYDNSDGYGYPAGGLVAALASDLSIQKTAGAPIVTVSTPITYTIVASNNGPDGVAGAIVTDTFPGTLTGVSWTCVASAGATCTPVGVAQINDVVTLPAGSHVTYSVTATGPATPTLVSNTATIQAPGNANDPNPGNNSSTADVQTVLMLPTMSEWTLILFGLALVLAGAFAIPRG
jgi:uncharacterized repeat protein (TIGR01451 family)